MRLFTAFLLLFGLISACTSPRGGPPRAGHVSRDEVLRQISAPAGATFLSYNGHWQGTDIDKQITFKKDNRAEVTHFGFGVDTYQGTYTVEESGAIHLSLRKAPEPWPIMYLYVDEQGPLLLPEGMPRAGAHWPLRRIR